MKPGVLGLCILAASLPGLLLMAVPAGGAAPPPCLPPVPHPVGNPPTAAKVHLGRMLFFDPVLSANRRIACATCHDPAHGFADPRGFSTGVTGETLPRDTPSAADLAWTGALFRDGRAGSLEEQALEPLFSPKEMAANAELVLASLRGNQAYRALFAAAFGDEEVSLVRLARAIAAYERTLITARTPYDRWAAGDESALSEAQKRGFEIFAGKAKCAECHPAPLFASDDVDPVGSVDRRPDGSFALAADPGLMQHTGDEAHRGAFRAVTLRGLKRTAPYMHNGVFATLAEVVDFYDRGGARGLGIEVALQDENVRPLGLSALEKADLVAFLEALSQDAPLDEAPERVPSGLRPGGHR
jgi:cytochrome c peroxidase